jgi:hypothetical protein
MIVTHLGRTRAGNAVMFHGGLRGPAIYFIQMTLGLSNGTTAISRSIHLDRMVYPFRYRSLFNPTFPFEVGLKRVDRTNASIHEALTVRRALRRAEQ